MVAPIEPPSPPARRVLVLTRLLDAPRSLVFSVWTRPEHLARWWGPKDFTLPFCEADFRVGGAYRFCMRSPAGTDHWVSGVYREIVEPERIVFTWEREDAEGQGGSGSVVTVTFADRDGRTELTLRQAVFKSAKARDEHQGGWTECLERLAEYVAKL